MSQVGVESNFHISDFWGALTELQVCFASPQAIRNSSSSNELVADLQPLFDMVHEGSYSGQNLRSLGAFDFVTMVLLNSPKLSKTYIIESDKDLRASSGDLWGKIRKFLVNPDHLNPTELALTQEFIQLLTTEANSQREQLMNL